jgi:hypothetical protein
MLIMALITVGAGADHHADHVTDRADHDRENALDGI